MLIPAAGQVAAQRGNHRVVFLAELVQHPVGAAQRLEARPLPLLVPGGHRVHLVEVGGLIVAIAGRQPDFIGVFRLDARQVMRHGVLHAPDGCDPGHAAPVRRRVQPEHHAAVAVVAARVYQDFFAALGALPVEDAGQVAVEVHVDARRAALALGVPGRALHAGLLQPGARGQRVPLVGRENNVPVSGLGVRLDHCPAQAVVVDHGQGVAVHARLAQQPALFIGRAAQLLQAVDLRVVARKPRAHADLSRLYVLAHQLFRRARAAVERVVAEEPGAFDRVAVLIFGRSVGRLVAQRRRLLQEARAVVALYVLRVVQADVGVRGNHHVDAPLTGLLPGSLLARQQLARKRPQFPVHLPRPLGTGQHRPRVTFARGNAYFLFADHFAAGSVRRPQYRVNRLALKARVHLDRLPVRSVDHRHRHDMQPGSFCHTHSSVRVVQKGFSRTLCLYFNIPCAHFKGTIRTARCTFRQAEPGGGAVAGRTNPSAIGQSLRILRSSECAVLLPIRRKRSVDVSAGRADSQLLAPVLATTLRAID